MPELSDLIPRLERELGLAGSEPVALTGGITNRNYRVRLAGHDCVLRLPGRDTEVLGIDRAAERLAAKRAASLGIGPELLHADADCVVTEFVVGDAVDAAQLRADPGRSPAPCAPSTTAVSICPHASGSRICCGSMRGRCTRAAARLPAGYGRAQALVDRIAAVLPLTDPVPCHDDLLAGNLIRTHETILLVDWEYAGIGHRYFDLGNLAVNNEFDEDCRGAPARGLLRRAGRGRRARFATCRSAPLPARLRRPRGRLGRRLRDCSRNSSSTSPLTLTSISSGSNGPPPTPDWRNI